MLGMRPGVSLLDSSKPTPYAAASTLADGRSFPEVVKRLSRSEILSAGSRFPLPYGIRRFQNGLGRAYVLGAALRCSDPH